MTSFEGWANFYVIVGSSAGALIGLQFVVITLVHEIPISQDTAQVGDAFATPSVIHFCVALLLSALATVPWSGIAILAGLWGSIGIVGVVYVSIVLRRLLRQTIYRPVAEDWLFHVLLPGVAYITLALAAYLAYVHEWPAPFLVGAVALLLLFIGIHNAWDAVTYHVFVRRHTDHNPKR